MAGAEANEVDAAPADVAINPARPWQGPRAYTEADHALFYGRELEVQQLLQLLERQTLTVLFGWSGLGKSSLLQAGLFPELRKRNALPICPDLAFEDGAEELRTQLLEELQRQARSHSVDGPEVRPGDDLWTHFHRETSWYWTETQHVVTPVLVLDQFEEVFTLGQQTAEGRARVERFVIELAQLVEGRAPEAVRQRLEASQNTLSDVGLAVKGSPFKVLLCLREDYLASLEPIREIMPSLGQGRFRLTPMKAEQAMQAVVKPGERYGLLQDGVGDGIVAFVADLVSPLSYGGLLQHYAATEVPTSGHDVATVDLALLSILCWGLNEKRILRKQAQIGLELLESNKRFIIRGYYEEQIADLPKHVQMYVEDELVSEEGHRTSRSIDGAKARFDVSPEHLETLVDRRVLRYVVKGAGPQSVEISHDVLLKEAIVPRRDARRAVEERKARLRKLLWSWLRPLMAGATVFAAYYAAYYYLWVREYVVECSEANLVEVRGQPRCLSPLTAEQVAERPASHRITTQGRWGRTLREAMVDGRGQLTPYHVQDTYFARWKADDPKRNRAVQWEYHYGQGDTLRMIEARDREGRQVWMRFLAHEQSVVSPPRKNTRTTSYAGPNALLLPDLSPIAHEAYQSTSGLVERVTFHDRWTEQPVSDMDGSYGYTSHYDDQGRLRRFESLGKSGMRDPDSFGVSGYELGRSADGNIAEYRFYRDCPGQELPEGCVGELPVVSQDGSAVQRVHYDYAGNAVWLGYFETDGRPGRCRDGYHALATEYQGGKIQKITYWDWDEAQKPGAEQQPTYDRLGCYGYAYAYDAGGHRRETRCLGEDGKPVVSAKGWAIRGETNDPHGDVKERWALDANGDPAAFRDFKLPESDEVIEPGGYHRVSFERDDTGRETHRRYKSAANAPVLVQGYAHRERKYDRAGNLVEEIYFGLDEKPVLLPDGYSQVVRSYDKNSRLAEERYLGLRGELVFNQERYAGRRFSYDERGYLERVDYLAPARTASPFDPKATTRAHDLQGERSQNTVRSVVAAEPSLNFTPTLTAVASDQRPRVDPQTNVVGQSAGDGERSSAKQPAGPIHPFAAASPSTNRKSIADEQAQDDGGQRSKLQRRSSSVVLQALSRGQASAEYVHDDLNRLLEVRYLDLGEQPVQRDDGVSQIRIKYDVQGNETERRTYGLNDTPAQDEEGVFETDSRFDERGWLIESTWLGVDWKPLEAGGFWGKSYKRDAWGRVQELCYLGTDRKAAAVPEGYSCETSRYDRLGNREVVEYFGTQGQRVTRSDDSTTDSAAAEHRNGYHSVRSRYDGWNLIERSYHDTDGKLVTGPLGYARQVIERQKTAIGVLKTIRLLDASDQPVLGRETVDDDELTEVSYAVAVTQYDTQDRWRSVRYFGPDEALLRANGRKQENGCAGMTDDYDDRDRLSKRCCWDERFERALSRQGYHCSVREYDELHGMMQTTYVDIDEMPLSPHDGCAKWRRHDITPTAEVSPRTKEWWCLDTSGKPIESTSGYAGIRRVTDAQGRTTEEAYFGIDGAPREVDVKDELFSPCARRRLTHDGMGRLTLRECESVLRNGKIFTSVEELDRDEDWIGYWFNVDGKPSSSEGQVYKTRRSWDAAHGVWIEFYEDLYGKPMKGPSTYWGKQPRVCGHVTAAGTTRAVCQPALYNPPSSTEESASMAQLRNP